jgi:hypothetical protein
MVFTKLRHLIQVNSEKESTKAIFIFINLCQSLYSSLIETTKISVEPKYVNIAVKESVEVEWWPNIDRN